MKTGHDYVTRTLDDQDAAWLKDLACQHCHQPVAVRTQLEEPGRQRVTLQVMFESGTYETVFRERVADRNQAGILRRFADLGWLRGSVMPTRDEAPAPSLEQAIEAAERVFGSIPA